MRQVLSPARSSTAAPADVVRANRVPVAELVAGSSSGWAGFWPSSWGCPCWGQAASPWQKPPTRERIRRPVGWST